MSLTEKIDAIFESKNTTIARDLKLNLKKLVGEGALAPEEGALALLALSTSVGHEALAAAAAADLKSRDFSEEHILEARESAAIMGMLNTYYKFRTMIANDTDYVTTGLRMTALGRPGLGKERFEMLSLAVSVLNGCEKCIVAHEKVLREAGVSIDKVHDLARLAAVVKGVAALA